MSTSAAEKDTRVADVQVSARTLTVHLMDGRTISAPLSWFPRLEGASESQLNNWEECAGGHGIHWPDLDEDISTAGLLSGNRAQT